MEEDEFENLFTNIGEMETCVFCDNPTSDVYVVSSDSEGICEHCILDALTALKADLFGSKKQATLEVAAE